MQIGNHCIRLFALFMNRMGLRCLVSSCVLILFLLFIVIYSTSVFYMYVVILTASLLPLRLPNAFALNSTNSIATAGSASEGVSSPVETDTLKIEEVQAPATGTRKAKVLYDYDAADSSELSLLADEVRFHHQPAATDLNNGYWSLAKSVSRSRSKQ